MPIHDWSPVDAGIFHHFHQAWTIEIRNALNAGLLPHGFFDLALRAEDDSDMQQVLAEIERIEGHGPLWQFRSDRRRRSWLETLGGRFASQGCEGRFA